ncbi:MAG: hypothetical protein K0R09_2116 [Clostridiales bacterium]|nr:hypothetical protein [Clostridiales bacterium]
MFNLEPADYVLINDGLFDVLNKRKNLMVYEGIKDGLKAGIKNKYCYSSPYDPLEFVILDIYNKPVIKNIENKKVEIFGIMSIIKEEVKNAIKEFDTIYGNVCIENILIRGIKKNEVRLNINRIGIQDLIGAVLYFEDYFCKKCNLKGAYE